MFKFDFNSNANYAFLIIITGTPLTSMYGKTSKKKKDHVQSTFSSFRPCQVIMESSNLEYFK